jgi:hypothetical protein
MKVSSNNIKQTLILFPCKLKTGEFNHQYFEKQKILKIASNFTK